VVTALKTPVTSRDHIQGNNKDAPLTLLEYGDFECPYCGRAHPIVKALQQEFGDQLRFVYRHFPLAQMHPHAESAAETAEYAGAHRRFWEMHDLLFENQDQLGLPLYQELAQELGLSPNGLIQALEEGRFRARVREDFSSGVRSGVNGTPTFFINGVRYDGPVDVESMADALGYVLERAA
jgi:protein-disulfide isomerase